MIKIFISVVVVFSFLLFPCCSKKDDGVGRTPRMSSASTDMIVMQIGNNKIILRKGDITKLRFDLSKNAAIVNAANEKLSHGSGVCGAIYAAAGSGLDDETNGMPVVVAGSTIKCPTGFAAITKSYNLLPNGIVSIVHAVGPIGEQQELLKSAYTQALIVASKNGVHTIAFPCISTGIFAYPKDKAAPVAVTAAIDYFIKNTNGPVTEIIFVCNGGDHKLYSDIFEEQSDYPVTTLPVPLTM